jgi:hypothetical protein
VRSLLEDKAMTYEHRFISYPLLFALGVTVGAFAVWAVS